MLKDKDQNSNVAIHLSALKGRSEVCAQLLIHGADPNAKKSFSSTTALHRAAMIGNAAFCAVLIDVRMKLSAECMQY